MGSDTRYLLVVYSVVVFADEDDRMSVLAAELVQQSGSLAAPPGISRQQLINRYIPLGLSVSLVFEMSFSKDIVMESRLRIDAQTQKVLLSLAISLPLLPPEGKINISIV